MGTCGMTLPPLIAHHGVVVYLTAAASTATQTAWTSLNAIARDGTNGSLVVSRSHRRPPGPEAPTSFKQVLGIDHDSENTSILAALAIPHLVLTTSTDVCAALSNAATVEYAAPHALAARVLSYISSTKRSIVVVHMDVADFTDSLNQCLESLVSSDDSTCFVGIIKETSLRPDPSPSQIPFPLPKQSWLKRDGDYAADPSAFSPSLVYSFFLRQQTRQDAVAAYDEAAIIAQGGYQCMQARVALREVAFRLGHVPKYGA